MAEVPLMKAVIDGGTTVQVTAQESDSDEEDDENVYNVKVSNVQIIHILFVITD